MKLKILDVFIMKKLYDYPDFGHPLANAVSAVNLIWEYRFAEQEMELI